MKSVLAPTIRAFPTMHHQLVVIHILSAAQWHLCELNEKTHQPERPKYNLIQFGSHMLQFMSPYK